MRDLFKIIEALAGSKSIVSFHYKSFPVKPFYLTIHDDKSECHMYEGDTIDELESEVVKEWSHLLTPVIPTSLPKPSMPLPPGMPRP